MQKCFLYMLVSAFLLSSLPAYSQNDALESVPVHKNERSFTFSLATNGLGLGGSYRFKLPNYYHVGFNLEFFILRDDKEFEIFDPIIGPVKLNNINRFFMIPANIEIKKRLFTDDIEDNFRPHLMLQAGGVFGMNFPKERQVIDGNQSRLIKPDNEYKLTYNVVLGLGVDVTTRKDFFVTIRPQYRLTFFTDDIAGKKDHSAFEIKFEIGGQF